MNGQLDEIIYRSNPDNKKISLLEWDKKYFFAGGKFCFKKSFFRAVGSASMALHDGFGEMRDSDWLNASELDMKTTYSTGKTTDNQNYDFQLNLFCDISALQNIKISPLIGIQYDYDYFDRNVNIKGWYGNYKGTYDENGILVTVKERNDPVEWNSPDALKFPYRRWDQASERWMTGRLGDIEYYRHSLYTWLGVDISFAFTDSFNAGIGYKCAPFTYFSSMDRHHGKDFDVHMIQYCWWNHIKLSVFGSYRINDRFSIKVSSAVLTGNVEKGDLYEGWVLNQLQKCGASVREFNTSFGITYYFIR